MLIPAVRRALLVCCGNAPACPALSPAQTQCANHIPGLARPNPARQGLPARYLVLILFNFIFCFVWGIFHVIPMCFLSVPAFTICILRNMTERLPASALRTVQVRNKIFLVLNLGSIESLNSYSKLAGLTHNFFEETVSRYFLLRIFSWISFSW